MHASPYRIAAAGCGMLAIAIGVGRFALTPVLPLMQETGVSMSQGAALASANYFGYLIGALTAIGSRVSPPRVIRASLVLIGLVTVAMGFCPWYAGWLALRAIAGVASAWVLVFASAWALQTLSAAGRPALSGLVFAGVGGGIAAVGVLVIAAARAGGGASAAWVLLGMPAFVTAALISTILRLQPTPGAGNRVASSISALRDATRPIVAYGALGFGYIIPATFLPLMAKQLVGAGASFEWAWPVFGLAAAVSTLVSARVRAHPQQVWIAGNLIMAAGLAAPVFWSGIGAVVAAALLVGATFMVITLAGLQWARERAGERATALIAAMTSAFAAGQIAGPLVADALFARRQDFSGALLAACAAMLLATYVLARGRTRSAVLSPQTEKTR